MRRAWLSVAAIHDSVPLVEQLTQLVGGGIQRVHVHVVPAPGNRPVRAAYRAFHTSRQRTDPAPVASAQRQVRAEEVVQGDH